MYMIISEGINSFGHYYEISIDQLNYRCCYYYMSKREAEAAARRETNTKGKHFIKIEV